MMLKYDFAQGVRRPGFISRQMESDSEEVFCLLMYVNGINSYSYSYSCI